MNTKPMNRLALSVFLMTFLADILLSESGSRYPIDSTSAWRIDHVRNGVSNENKHEPGDDIFQYFIQGDTIINLKSYFKIYKTGTSYFPEPFYYENVYAGALRDANHKFFFVKKNQNTEILLYDFNVKVGDTIKVPLEENFETKIVSSIDSLPDGRRLIHFNPKEPIIGCGDQYYIEGIGGSGGLLEGPSCGHFWTPDNHLVCYLQNDQMIYHDYNFDYNCDIANSSIDKTLDTNGIWHINSSVNSDTLYKLENIEYFFAGDTTIQTKSYSKFMKRGFLLQIRENGQFFSGKIDSVYVGALRSDHHKVFYIAKGENTEILAHNYNHQAGQLYDGMIFHDDTIKTVDTILDNRKVFYFDDSPWGIKIIEGIGTDLGLLDSPDNNSFIVCYRNGNSIIYNTGNGADCALSYASFGNYYDCHQAKVWPENPTTSDYIKLIVRTCFEVSSSHPQLPNVGQLTGERDENDFMYNLFYNYDRKANEDVMMNLVPKFDTLDLGVLQKGQYTINLAVHSINHYNNESDTTHYLHMQYLSFDVTQSNSGIIPPPGQKPFKIYPNPANNYFVIESPDFNASIESVEIYNMLGSKVATINLKDQRKLIQTIDVSQLNKGIYLVTILGDNCSIIYKIIVQ